MDGLRKLGIPANAAKYDAACTSSGTELQDSRNKADRSSFSETTSHSLTCCRARGLPNGSSRNHNNPGSFF